MSEVRMCDVQRSSECLQIFSVKERGWQKVTSDVVEEDPATGAQMTVRVTLDACPNCSMTPRRSPRLRALEPTREEKTSDLSSVSERQTRSV